MSRKITPTDIKASGSNITFEPIIPNPLVRTKPSKQQLSIIIQTAEEEFVKLKRSSREETKNIFKLEMKETLVPFITSMIEGNISKLFLPSETILTLETITDLDYPHSIFYTGLVKLLRKLLNILIAKVDGKYELTPKTEYWIIPEKDHVSTFEFLFNLHQILAEFISSILKLLNFLLMEINIPQLFYRIKARCLDKLKNLFNSLFLEAKPTDFSKLLDNVKLIGDGFTLVTDQMIPVEVIEAKYDNLKLLKKKMIFDQYDHDIDSMIINPMYLSIKFRYTIYLALLNKVRSILEANADQTKQLIKLRRTTGIYVTSNLVDIAKVIRDRVEKRLNELDRIYKTNGFPRLGPRGVEILITYFQFKQNSIEIISSNYSLKSIRIRATILTNEVIFRQRIDALSREIESISTKGLLINSDAMTEEVLALSRRLETIYDALGSLLPTVELELDKLYS